MVLNQDLEEKRMVNVIEARGLTKQFGDTTAVDNVTLSVPQGSLFGLLGPNGSGKTTMIKILTGQLRPTNGEATVLGLNVLEAAGIERPVGYALLVGGEGEILPILVLGNGRSGRKQYGGLGHGLQGRKRHTPFQ